VSLHHVTGSTRGIQGRFNDISLICASNATRDSDGNLTEGANRSLTDIKRIMGVLHNMYWCSVVIRFRCICKSVLASSHLMQRHNSRLSTHMYLVTPEGFSYLKSKQLITFEEYRSLIEISKDGLGAHNAAMTWMVSRIELAVKRDEVHLSPGASTAIYDSIRNLRMLMARLPDMYDGRMNIAYIHFVNMLVSTLVLVRAIIYVNKHF